MDLLASAHRDDPALDMALTAAILEAVSSREIPETVRVFRPGATVAFGRMDRQMPGFPNAVKASLEHGRTPLVRLGGGHAAAYDGDCVLLEFVQANKGVHSGIELRFAELIDVLQDALSRCSVDTEQGKLPGEYCPGRFSLHLADGPKVAGIAQRITSRASLTAAVLVVGGGASLRATIAAIYGALEFPVDPATAGAVMDCHPNITTESVTDHLIDVVQERYQARSAAPTLKLIRRAAELIPTTVC